MAHGEDCKRIRAYIEAHPNIRAAAIADALGIDPKDVRGHINRLSQDGVIVGYRDRSTCYRLWRCASWRR